MESVLDSISSAESEDSVINEEFDAWQAEFKLDAKHLDVDDDEWRYDGDEEDNSICSEKIDDDDVNAVAVVTPCATLSLTGSGTGSDNGGAGATTILMDPIGRTMRSIR